MSHQELASPTTSAAVSQQVQSGPMTWTNGEDLVRAQSRESHRPGPRRTLLGAPFEVSESGVAHQVVGAAGGGRAQSPQASAPTILDDVRAAPPAVPVATVPTIASHALGARHEP